MQRHEEDQCPRCGALWPIGAYEPPCMACGWEPGEDTEPEDVDDYDYERDPVNQPENIR